MYVTRNHYEEAPEFDADAYAVDEYRGIAFRCLGWETEPDEDTEWTGYEQRTGLLVVRMVGDDRNFHVEPEELRELDRGDFCGECGQVGCTHDGYPREEEE